MCDLKFEKCVDAKKFSEFLLNLSKKTILTFNHFGEINSKNIELIVQKELERKDKIKFFVFLNNEMIGYGFLTKFEKIAKKHNCILGIVLTDSWQNQGFGKKICQHMIKTAWDKNMEKIWLTVYEENKIAKKMYKSLGFEIEGVFMKDEIIDNDEKNVISMAIFKNKDFDSKKRIKIISEN